MKGKIADAQNANLDSAVLMQDFPSKIKTFDFLFFNFNESTFAFKIFGTAKIY
jgi:hypothetical protein